ncbi:MAG: glycosyltransferase family 4 protein [bacterium]
MKKLRIAVITMEFITEPYFSGGVANHFYRKFRSIAERGHEVHIFTHSDKNEPPFDFNGLQIHRVQGSSSSGRFKRLFDRLRRNSFAKTSLWLNFSFHVSRRIRKVHQKLPFDLIQCPNSYGCGLFSRLLIPIPLVTNVSCYRPVWNKLGQIERTFDMRMIEKLEWLQYRFSRFIYSPSQILQKILKEEAKIFNVEVIRTPIFQETYELDPKIYRENLMGKEYLLFFGRYQLHKGFHILAQALPAVLEAFPEANAVFVGKDVSSMLAPSMKDYAIQRAGDYAHRLIFFDQIKHEQLYPIISHARIVVLPSLIDNLPNTLMETMLLEKPVIGTIGASFDELITEGENGFLVPSNDPVSLAEKIIAVWPRKDLKYIGQRAKEKAYELAPEKTIQHLLQYYEKVIGQGG